LQSPLLKPELAGRVSIFQFSERKKDNVTWYLSLYEEYSKKAEEEKEKEPEEREVLILPDEDFFYLSKKENWDVLSGLLKDKADDYLSSVNNRQISMSLTDREIIDNQKETILTQLWFSGNLLRGDYMGYRRRFFKMCGKYEGIKDPFKCKEKAYTLKQISKALRKEELSGIEEKLMDRLRGD